MKIILLITLVISLGLGGVLLGETGQISTNLGQYASFHSFNRDGIVSNGIGAGLKVAGSLNNLFLLEGNLAMIAIKDKLDGNAAKFLKEYSLHALYKGSSIDQNLDVFFSLGVGMSANDFNFAYGVVGKYKLNEHLFLRVDYLKMSDDRICFGLENILDFLVNPMLKKEKRNEVKIEELENVAAKHSVSNQSENNHITDLQVPKFEPEEIVVAVQDDLSQMEWGEGLDLPDDEEIKEEEMELESVKLSDSMAIGEAEIVKPYTDLSDHWVKETAEKLKEIGLLENSDKFSPKKKITRAEFAHMTVKMLKLKSVSDEQINFSDVMAGDNNFYDIKIVVQRGILSTDEVNAFRPNDYVTRAEAVAGIVRAARIATSYNPKLYFNDVSKNHWVNKYLAAAVESKLIVPGNSFYPRRVITKAEIVSIFSKIQEINNHIMR